MSPTFLAVGKIAWPVVETVCEWILKLKPPLQLLQGESFLERAVNHLRPQCTLFYKKGNLQVLCFLDKGMKSNFIFLLNTRQMSKGEGKIELF